MRFIDQTKLRPTKGRSFFLIVNFYVYIYTTRVLFVKDLFFSLTI